jgi:Peptidase family M23
VTVAGPTPVLPAPSLPTTVPGVLTIGMPVEPGDTGNSAFGIAPFGYHGADHAEDGHPGWDIEYRVGGTVRAAAAGTIQSVFPDPFTPARTTVQVEHLVGSHHYRTVYTNIATVAADIAANAAVRAGQPIGIAGTVTATIGTQAVTYAMTHFQLDDFEYYREIPNPNAVSPEAFLSAQARPFFDALWAHATFGHELVEPFVTNPRELRFPASRTWTRAGGDGPAGIRFTRRNSRASMEYDYALLAESGSVIESGTATISPTKRPNATIDLVSPTSTRVGLYDIISNEMRLSLAPPGSTRPADLVTASVYRTIQ